MWASDTAQIFLDDVRVPQRYLIGQEGGGSSCRCCSSRRSDCGGRRTPVGAFEEVIRETIEYTRTRRAFGQAILDNQWVHYKLAEMISEVELLRSLIYQATEQMLDG